MSLLTSINKVASSNQRCIYQAFTQRSSTARSYFQSDSSEQNQPKSSCSPYKYFSENEQCSKTQGLLQSVKARVEDSIRNTFGTNFWPGAESHGNNQLSCDSNIRESNRSKITDEITGAVTWTGAAVVTNALMQHISKNDEPAALPLSTVAFCRVLHALCNLSPGKTAATLSVLPANIATNLNRDDQESSNVSDSFGDKKPANSLDEAMRKFTSSMKNSSAASQNALAILLQRSGHHKKAVQFFKESSSQGYSKAQYNMGLCYHHGYGVGRDIDLAVDFYERAALQGHPLAQYNYGSYLIENGKGQQAIEKGLGFLKDSASKGTTTAQCYLGQYYLKRKNLKGNGELAVKYFRMAADQLDVKGQYYLAICYEKGVGVEIDLVEARKLYEACVEQGLAKASASLGIYYEKGLGGLQVDKAKAVSLYRKATYAGSHKAKSRLESMKKEGSRQENHCTKEATLSEEIGKHLIGRFFPMGASVVQFPPTRRQGSLRTETSSSESDPEELLPSYQGNIGPLSLSALFSNPNTNNGLAVDHP